MCRVDVSGHELEDIRKDMGEDVGHAGRQPRDEEPEEKIEDKVAILPRFCRLPFDGLIGVE